MKAWNCLVVGLLALGLCTGFSHFGGWRAPSAFAAHHAMGDQTHVRGQGTFHHGGSFRHHHQSHDGAILLFGAPLFIAPPTDAVPAPAGEYIEQQPGVSYYCPGAGYYPQVSDCPAGWLRVEPAESPPQ